MRITDGKNTWKKVEGVMEIDAYLVYVNESAQLVCYPGIHECTRDDGTNKETTGEGQGLRKQPGENNRES